ncbi:MAG: phosphate-starvation-inducible E-like protein [Deltaproteobacteria bacterium RBG_16_47_11]|nr:MAG: phosphate-starvation-inducible E-like protein [Deltaproteobacteria bacterium RBG_16_47_11]
MLTYLKKFERIIVISLIGMMAVTITLTTIELGWLIIKEIVTPPLFMPEPNELLNIFGIFLLVLVGIELVYTLKTYLTENALHVEVVLMAALIAIGRKVIILDVKELSGLTLVGIAAIMFALSFGYYFIKQHSSDNGSAKKP